LHFSKVLKFKSPSSITIQTTSKNWPKCNHYICDYMRLLIISNYIWTFLQLFFVSVIFATIVQLVCNYFGVHPSMWTTFGLVSTKKTIYVALVANVTNLVATLSINKGVFCEL
jgi:hypothetical protein